MRSWTGSDLTKLHIHVFKNAHVHPSTEGWVHLSLEGSDTWSLQPWQVPDYQKNDIAKEKKWFVFISQAELNEKAKKLHKL